MPLKLEFIGWERPGLSAAADYLVRRYATGTSLDMERVVAALPGSRAGRRLLEILVTRADAEKLTLVPPQIVTTGHLPELLYRAKKPFAGELAQQLAWIQALREINQRRLSRLMPVLPDRDDLLAWLPLGEMLARLHRELAGDALEFTDVVREGKQLPGFDESERWKVLAELQSGYLRTLDNLGLWDLQTARLFAIEHKECQTDLDIVLIGSVDLNRAQRKMLDLVADRATSLVCAPDELRDRFDEHGCLNPDAWREAILDVTTDRIEVVDHPREQADAVLRTLSSWNGEYAADQIVVGIPDASLVPYLEQRFSECDLPIRVGSGMPLTRSGPYRLLEGVAEFLERGTFHDLAALVRHPAVGHWLSAHGLGAQWLTSLDQYHSQHLPAHLDLLEEADPEAPSAQPTAAPGGAKQAESRSESQQAADVLQQVRRLLEEFVTGLRGKPRPLSDWDGAIVALLVQAFGRADLDRSHEPDRLVLSACDQIFATLNEHSQIDATMTPSVTSADALRMLLRALDGATLPPRADKSAIELLGWLELPLDDAPALVVTGFNEGIIPASRNGDLFLPNELRRILELDDNERKYARDAYALSVLVASHKELKLIAGRRSVRNDPLSPSRLLFASDEETMAKRVDRFFSPRQSSHEPLRLRKSLSAGQKLAQFHVPRPEPLAKPVTQMRVTEFKDYLSCPYRYYLRHRLRLKALDDSAEELEANDFGSLLHKVLHGFADGPMSASIDVEEIMRELDTTLDALVKEEFGESLRPAIALQIEQLRLRLEAFAKWQADWSAAGWKIRKSEFEISEKSSVLMVDGRPLSLKGRIDRIDIHERTGACVVFDYKTGDKAEPPDKTHRKQGDWVDLQLPLYRHAIREVEVPGPVQLGYIVIPRDLKKVGEHIAEWDDDLLAAADRKAEEVIRNVRAEVFWPPAVPPPAFFEDLGAICQDQRFGAGADEEGSE